MTKNTGRVDTLEDKFKQRDIEFIKITKMMAEVGGSAAELNTDKYDIKDLNVGWLRERIGETIF